MPAPVEDFISVPAATAIRVTLDAVQSQFYSLLLVAQVDHYSGLSDWVYQTAQALSAEERRDHGVVMLGFYYAVLPDQNWSSFPAYLNTLSSLSPSALRSRLLGAYARMSTSKWSEEREEGEKTGSEVNWDMVLGSVDNYLSFLRKRFDESHLDVEIETQAYHLLLEPAEMKKLVVSHLRKMWDRYLAQEWERVRPMLQDSVRAFQQIDFTQMSRLEAARLVAGPALEEKYWRKQLEKAERMIFVPNAHVGPYVGKIDSGNTLWMLFGARLPEGAQMEAPDLSRAEILVRLSALADDSRLRILKFISENGEQRSQDIMQSLNLSQSAASRHLTQLTATGHLSERRCEGAKCYDLNPERIEETLQAVSAFLLRHSG